MPLLDVKKREILYERSVSDAEMMPFYFLAVVPLEGTQALIAFEVEGNSGIKTQFEDDFEAFIQQKCKESDLEIERLVPEKLVNQYFKKGRVTKLRFVRFRVPTDIADAVKLGIAEQGTTMELQVRAKRGTTFSIGRSIQDILHGNLDAKDFVQIKGFEFDTVKIEFDMDGKRRTMDLAAPNSFRADYNVTEKVDMYGGHPRYNSIDKIAREIVREIMSSLRLEAEGV